MATPDENTIAKKLIVETILVVRAFLIFMAMKYPAIKKS